MKRIGWIGSVLLVCSTAFVSAETLQVKGPDSILDGYISVTYSYHEFGMDYVQFREYWGSNDYDVRAFFRVDLSAIPEGMMIDSASFKLRVHSATTNSDPLGVDLWQASPFTQDMTAATCDGTNPWPNGTFDGVDGYYRTPADRILATTPISTAEIDSYVEFSGSKLNEYIQAQSNQAAGERYAYFQMSWPDDPCDYWAAFYSSEAGEGYQPYLEISWGGGSTGFPGDANDDGIVDVGDLGILAGNYGQSAAASVPEPASLSLLGLGLFALLRRKS